MLFRKKLNIVVTGAHGQLGSYLVNYFKQKSLLEKPRIGKVLGIDKEDLDISDAQAVANFFDKIAANPLASIDYVIHCAAATDTTAIEKDPSKFYAANCLGPKYIAQSCARNGIKMVFISTDYVLSELSPSFGTSMQEFPVNQYGLQKLIAEQFVKEAYRDKPNDCMVLRSSWMFGNSDKSFVEKFLANAFRAYATAVASSKAPIAEHSVEVKVACDAYGRPTPVWFIADTIESLMLCNVHGTMDLQYPWIQISRYDWATMIWKAFIDMSCECDSRTSKLASELRSSIIVTAAKSQDIGILMHHPGKLQMTSASSNDSIELGKNQYMQDTKMYVNKNWHKYIELANKITNGSK